VSRKDSGIYIDTNYVARGITDEKEAEEIADYFAALILEDYDKIDFARRLAEFE